jgi:hypothetical protein
MLPSGRLDTGMLAKLQRIRKRLSRSLKTDNAGGRMFHHQEELIGQTG